MYIKHTLIAIALSSITVISCGNNMKSNTNTVQHNNSEMTNTQGEPPALKKKIQAIRDNFTRINKISKWTRVEKKDLMEESTEGGEATYYYANGKLEKIIVTLYGEMGKLAAEYYLMNGELSFVFEQFHEYNRPIYYDKEMAKENEDNEWFDEKKTKLLERRYYLENEKVFHIKSANDEDTEDVRAYETDRHKEFYAKLIALQMD